MTRTDKIIYRIILLTLCLPLAVSAQQLNNLGEANVGSIAVGENGAGDSVRVAQAFRTGSISCANTEITVVLNMRSINKPGSNTFMLHIFGDDGGGSPGISIATLSGPTHPNPNPIAEANYSYSGTISLLANTTYHIVARAPSNVIDRSYAWGRTSSGVFNEMDGFSVPGFKQRSLEGADWEVTTEDYMSFSLAADGCAIMTTPTQPIPTMGEWGLISLGLCMLILGVVAVGRKVVAMG